MQDQHAGAGRAAALSARLMGVSPPARKEHAASASRRGGTTLDERGPKPPARADRIMAIGVDGKSDHSKAKVPVTNGTAALVPLIAGRTALGLEAHDLLAGRHQAAAADRSGQVRAACGPAPVVARDHRQHRRMAGDGGGAERRLVARGRDDHRTTGRRLAKRLLEFALRVRRRRREGNAQVQNPSARRHTFDDSVGQLLGAGAGSVGVSGSRLEKDSAVPATCNPGRSPARHTLALPIECRRHRSDARVRTARAPRRTGLARRKRSDVFGRKLGVVGGDWTVNQSDGYLGSAGVRPIRRERLTTSNGDRLLGASASMPNILKLRQNHTKLERLPQGQFCRFGFTNQVENNAWRNTYGRAGQCSRQP